MFKYRKKAILCGAVIILSGCAAKSYEATSFITRDKDNQTVTHVLYSWELYDIATPAKADHKQMIIKNYGRDAKIISHTFEVSNPGFDPEDLPPPPPKKASR